MTQILLASGSPRRKELMGLLPVTFTVKTKEVEEKVDPTQTPAENVCNLAYQKAQAVSLDHPEEWVIGCDTVVVYKGKILGKPKDETDAKAMLDTLSGDAHEVYTGVCICHQEKGICEKFYTASKVKMKHIAPWERDQYVASKEPMDKAGSYAIQGLGAVFVEGIEGDYFNIVGLPVAKLYDTLKDLHVISPE